MQDSFRKSHLALTLFGPLAVAASVASFKAGRPYMLTSAQLTLADTGVGAGSTTVVLKVNGVAITGNTSIAGAAAGKTADATLVAPAIGNFPAGVRINVGDLITADVTTIPATTAPKGGVFQLNLTQLDV